MKLLSPQQLEGHDVSQGKEISSSTEISKDQRFPCWPEMSPLSVDKSYSFSKEQRHQGKKNVG